MKDVLNVLFPRRCIFCGEFMKEAGEVCARCNEELPRLEEPLCELEMGDVERLYCAFFYDKKIPRGIYQLKFLGKSHIHRWFAGEMVRSMGDSLRRENIDLVCCVPMHRKRRKKRGYNQAQLLAKEAAKLLNLPYADCLKKVKLTEEQHLLSGRERRLKQRDSFASMPLNGERILLIDDICTSGETMKECARMLKAAGASVVIGAAVCRATRVPQQPVEAKRKLWYS